MFDSNSCSLQGPSAMRMRTPSSTGLKAIVASAWLAVLLGSASLAACEDAGGVPFVLLLRHGDLALFFFSSGSVAPFSYRPTPPQFSRLFLLGFFCEFVSVVQGFSQQFFCCGG